MSDEFKHRNRMQEGDAPPVIEDTRRRRMDDRPVRPRRIKRRIVRMEDVSRLQAVAYDTAPDAGDLDLMRPLPEETALAASLEAKPVSDQQERIPEGVGTDPDRGERYVRLRLRVEGDQISLVGVRTVEGPLVRPERLHGGLAYELTRDQKQVVVGSLPDVGVRRSFPHPERLPGMEGHHITELPSYEFQVRIPQKEFSRWALPRIRISVYRIKGDVPTRPIGPEPLHLQFADELRPVAELRGIHVDELSEALREEVHKALR